MVSPIHEFKADDYRIDFHQKNDGSFVGTYFQGDESQEYPVECGSEPFSNYVDRGDQPILDGKKLSGLNTARLFRHRVQHLPQALVS